MQRINNKTKKSLSSDSFAKHPGKFLKRDTSGRIRQQGKDAIGDFSVEHVPTPPAMDKNAARKQSGNCPICLARLKRNARRTRYCNVCDQCKGQLEPEVI